MKGKLDWRNAVVTAALPAATDIRVLEFALEHPEDGSSFRFEPGSHTNIALPLPGGRVIRSYSCLPAAPGRIRIGVKKHHKSRGGSDFLWTVQPGAKLRMTAPENRFALSWRASAYLLVAGGVGITPLLGMAHALAGGPAPVTLAYAISSRDQITFEDELRDLLGDRLTIHVSAEGQRLDLAAAIAGLPADGELYICGPIRMLNAAKALWSEAGRPQNRLRFEVFGEFGAATEQPFTVRIANHDETLEVQPGQSILDALSDAGVEMIWDCLRGECGLCKVDIVALDGTVDHRDVFFSEEQKAGNECLCTCVSRLTGGSVTIDTGYRPGPG